MSPLPRVLVLVVATLLLAGCTPGSEHPRTDPVAEIETAADAVRELDGVDDVELHRTTVAEPVPGNFGEREATTLSSVRVEVRLAETLGAGAAGAVAGKAHRLLVAGAGRLDGYDDVAVTTDFLAAPENPENSEDSENDRPWLSVGAGARAVPTALTDALARAVEDGYALHDAGAKTVSVGLGDGDDTWADDPIAATAHVTASTPDDLVSLAWKAVELGRGAELKAPGIRYGSISRVPDVDAVRLLVAVAGRPDVREAAYLAQQQQLEIQSDATAGAQSLADLHRWLRAQDFATAESPLAYTVLDADHAETTGWVSGAEPASHTLGPLAGATPWPDDPAAPDCSGESLDIAFGVVDSAAGTRGASVRARNVSGRPCAIENMPDLVFRNADGQAQTDITVEPYEPGVRPGRVVVPDGGSVLAPLLWQTMSTANDPDTTTAIDVTAVPGAEPVPLDVTTDGTPASGLDILDGAEVRVGLWIQAD